MDSSALNSNSYDVHLGFWTNWSYGSIQGATITLTRKNGGFLIAFLAIYVGMVGKSFWRLGCFSLHRYLSSTTPQDGLYHQRQAILRNSDTAQDGAWRLLVSMIAWRQRARRPFLRLLPIIIAAFLLSAAFGVASIFSSRVTADNVNEVLLVGNRCGTLNRTKAENVTAVYSLFKPYHAQLSSKFLDYGLRCYVNSSKSEDIDGCNLYPTPELPLVAQPNALCPFNETICSLKDQNLVLDTGRLHSLKHFGINSAPKDQFEVRFKHECAPLVTDTFTEIVTTDVGPVARLMYGKGSDGAYHQRAWTYEVPMDFPYNPANGTGFLGTSRPEYNVGITQTYAGDEELPENERLWSPIPELTRLDADVMMFFLSAPGIRFSAPVDDPWFSAHKNASTLYDQNNKTRPSWVQDSPVGVMACTIQTQYCNPNLRGEQCEPLRGQMTPGKTASIEKIFPSKSQYEMVTRADYILSLDSATIDLLVGMIGAAALRARYGLAYGYQGPLPSNQWQLEAVHWVKGELASIQDALVRAANGPPKELDPFLQLAEKEDHAAWNMCRNQKIVSVKFSSFNVLGLSLILLLGGAFILLDMSLEPIIAWFKKRNYQKLMLLNQGYNARQHPLHGVLEWSATSICQLQRLAHEKAGYGSWEDCSSDNPVTRPGEELGLLDVEDVDHPVLKFKRRQVDKIVGLRRTDTGLDTLVESIDERQEKKKMMEEIDFIVSRSGLNPPSSYDSEGKTP